MPAAGWYPDPEGVRGRYRYWDGRAWSAITTTDPRNPPAGFGPMTSSVGPPPPSPRRRRTGWLIAAVVALLAIAVVTGYAVLGPERDRQSETVPSSTVSSYDDGPRRSPTPTASPSGSPSVEESASANPSGNRPVACDLASPDQEPAPPEDGRVHGGPLSFAALPSPWSAATATSRVPYSRDSQVQVLRLPEKLPWQASAQVGITTFDPYPGGAVATQQMLECVMTSDFYTSVDVALAQNSSRSLQIDGRQATIRDARLTFSHPDLTTKGSLLRFVVVQSDPVSYFFSAIPMERTDLVTAIDETTGSLRVG